MPLLRGSSKEKKIFILMDRIDQVVGLVELRRALPEAEEHEVEQLANRSVGRRGRRDGEEHAGQHRDDGSELQSSLRGVQRRRVDRRAVESIGRGGHAPTVHPSTDPSNYQRRKRRHSPVRVLAEPLRSPSRPA